MALKILIVQEEAEKYDALIRERFPQEVASGEIRTILAHDEFSFQEDIMDVDIIGTWPLIKEVPQMKNLKWVMTFSSGIDHWEKSKLLPPHVPLIHLPGGSAIPISEFVLGLMLNFVKYYYEMRENQKEHKFIRIQGQELWGKTLGIIGLGGIGRALARKAKAFDMNVIGTEIGAPEIPYVDKVYDAPEFETVLREADFVVLSVPETKDTIEMMNEDRFRLMKKSAYFINCARGSLVVKQALIKALREGWIAGAAMDTFWIKNPLPSYLPPDDELWDAPNIVITPHISSWTDMYAARFGAVFVENIGHYLKGEPLTHVARLNY